MGIKVTVTPLGVEKYPYFGQLKELIVYFTGEKTGVVIRAGGAWLSGEKSGAWDETQFNYITGVISITQK